MLQKPTVSKICKQEPNFSSWVIAVDPMGQFRWLTLSMCLSTWLKWSQKRGYWLGGELPSNSMPWTVYKRDSFKSSLEDAPLLWEQWFVDSLNECTTVSPHSCPIMITLFTENTLTGFWATGSDGSWPQLQPWGTRFVQIFCLSVNSNSVTDPQLCFQGKKSNLCVIVLPLPLQKHRSRAFALPSKHSLILKILVF